MCMKDMAGMRVLITGSACRIGASIAHSFGERGAFVLVHYRTNRISAEIVSEKIRAVGGKSEIVKADLAVHEQVLDLVDHVKSVFGHLDILINNASFYPEPDKIRASYFFAKETDSNWQECLDVNAKAPFFLMQKLAPLMIDEPRPRVINILDACIDAPMSSRACYSISQSARAATTIAAAHALAPNIRVYGLALGPVLPGDKMSGKEQQKIKWIGVEQVVQEMFNLLDSEDPSGTIRFVK